MKYIIDIEDEYTKDWVNNTPMCKELCMPISVPNRQRTYHVITGFKLEPYTEPDRKAIEDEVWRFASMLMNMHPDVAEDIYWSINGGKGVGVAAEMTYSEAKAKYDAWKKEKDEIRVGDEVADKDGGCKGVVLETFGEHVAVMWTVGTVCDDYGMDKIIKTNRHFDYVEKLLEEMRE